MEGKENNDKRKNFYFSFKKIKKIYLPIILTIFIIFNLSFIPGPLGTNENMNFQPSSASGESYFFPSSNFQNKNTKSIKNDVGIAIWVLILILSIIIGIVYYIVNKIKNNEEKKEDNKNEYIELLKDDSDYEGNI